MRRRFVRGFRRKKVGRTGCRPMSSGAWRWDCRRSPERRPRSEAVRSQIGFRGDRKCPPSRTGCRPATIPGRRPRRRIGRQGSGSSRTFGIPLPAPPRWEAFHPRRRVCMTSEATSGSGARTPSNQARNPGWCGEVRGWTIFPISSSRPTATSADPNCGMSASASDVCWRPGRSGPGDGPRGKCSRSRMRTNQFPIQSLTLTAQFD